MNNCSHNLLTKPKSVWRCKDCGAPIPKATVISRIKEIALAIETESDFLSSLTFRPHAIIGSMNPLGSKYAVRYDEDHSDAEVVGVQN